MQRFRLPDSDASVAGLQSMLRAWWKERGHRSLKLLLQNVELSWNRGPMPSPSLLSEPGILALVRHATAVDCTIHPRHARLAAALYAEHGICAIFDKINVENESQRYAKLILLAFAKYRELQKDEDKMAAFMIKALCSCFVFDVWMFEFCVGHLLSTRSTQS